MGTQPPAEPQLPYSGDSETQARAAEAAAAERNAPPQPAAPSWQESSSHRPAYQQSEPRFAPYQPPSPRRRSHWYVWLIGGCLALLGVTILACAVLGGIFAGFLIRTANEIPVSQTSQQTFNVTGTPSLDIQDTAGNVTVVAGGDATISVEVTKSVRSATSDSARSDLDNIHVDVTQSGNVIKVVTTFNEGNGIGRQAHVDLTFTVPPTTNVSAQVTAGAISLTGITGLLNANVVAGSLETDGVTLADGSRIAITTGGLQFAGSVAPGASLDVSVDTGQASFALPTSTTTHLDAHTNVGTIEIAGWPLSASKDNVGASAVGDLGSNPQGTITVRVQTGNIDISQA